jgi:hypothetical protein
LRNTSRNWEIHNKSNTSWLAIKRDRYFCTKLIIDTGWSSVTRWRDWKRRKKLATYFCNDVIKNEFVKFMSTRQCHLNRTNKCPSITCRQRIGGKFNYKAFEKKNVQLS